MARSSGLFGCPPQLRPSASQPGPCRLPASHSRRRQCRLQFAPFMNLTSPSELRAFRPACPPPTHKGGRRRTSSSLEVSSPSAPENRSVHLPRLYLSRYVPPSPFHTTSTVYSAPTRPKVSLGFHSWGFLPFRVTPVSLRVPPSPTQPPLMTLPRLLLPYQGRVAPPCCLGVSPGSHSCEPTVSANFRFPFRRGSTPSWAFFCGASLPPTPRVSPFPRRPSGPVTCPDLKKSASNEAAEVKPRMVDAPTLMRWRGEQPQERSSVVVGSLAGLAAGGPGGRLGALRERLSLRGEQTGVVSAPGSSLGEDGRDQAERLKVGAGAANQ